MGKERSLSDRPRISEGPSAVRIGDRERRGEPIERGERGEVERARSGGGGGRGGGGGEGRGAGKGGEAEDGGSRLAEWRRGTGVGGLGEGAEGGWGSVGGVGAVAGGAR